jgi:purine catabolism regulator
VALTVQDLLGMAAVDSALLAGAGGVGREVAWAHACEMENPWDWLGPDELLMTVGLCIPAEPHRQADFVRQLVRAGLSGVAVGDDLKAPPLTEEMLRTADELDFPLLTVGHMTPFATIARTVAIANQSDQVSKVARLSRLYTMVRGAEKSGEPTLLERLSLEFGHTLHVVDARWGSPILRTRDPLPTRLLNQIVAETRTKLDRLPARVRATGGAAFALPSSRPAMLVVQTPADVSLDPLIVVHAINLLAVEVGRVSSEREQLTRQGRQLFADLLEGSVTPRLAAHELRRHGLDECGHVVAALPAEAGECCPAVLADHAVAHLYHEVGDICLLLVRQDAVTDVVSVLRPHVPVLGTSLPAQDLQRLNDGEREARWALQAAISQGHGHIGYSSAAPLFLPQSVTEAETAVRTVLGKAIDHDREHGSDLVATLEAFLTADRSWARAAEQLSIHKQTLGYRLRRIEALTGRKLARTKDLAEIWFALSALRIVSGNAEPRSERDDRPKWSVGGP